MPSYGAKWESGSVTNRLQWPSNITTHIYAITSYEFDSHNTKQINHLQTPKTVCCFLFKMWCTKALLVLLCSMFFDQEEFVWLMILL